MDDHNTLVGISLLSVIRLAPVKSRFDLVGSLIEPLTVPHDAFLVCVRKVITCIDCTMAPDEKVSLAPDIMAVYFFLSAVCSEIVLVVLSVLAKICGYIAAEKYDVTGLCVKRFHAVAERLVI